MRTLVKFDNNRPVDYGIKTNRTIDYGNSKTHSVARIVIEYLKISNCHRLVVKAPLGWTGRVRFTPCTPVFD